MDLTWTDGTLVVVAVADADSDLRLRPAACRILPTRCSPAHLISSLDVSGRLERKHTVKLLRVLRTCTREEEERQ